MRDIPLAWLQLKREPARLGVALAGVAFAVILVFMQFGFSDALYKSSVRLQAHLVTDLVLINPYSYLASMKSFSRRRLYQALGYEGVASVAPVYAETGFLRNPETGKPRQILVVGFEPSESAFDLEPVRANLDKLRLADHVLFDRASRPEYGLIASDLDKGRDVQTALADRRVRVVGLFELGTSFGIDGTVIASDTTFLHLFPDRPPGLIEIGLVRLRPGTNAEAVRTALAANLPKDVEVLTKQEYMEREKAYWRVTTPIGFIFGFGLVMGLIVGGVIVYQILFTDVSAHLRQYATLKAMGYTNRSLFTVVLQEALILSVLGYIPGCAVVLWLYRVTEAATLLPLAMNGWTSAEVLGLTVLMCGSAGAIALRKVRAADPAEIF